MWTYNYTSYDELYHHGIAGQRWGVRNGPPYPLKSTDYSQSEKKAQKSGSVLLTLAATTAATAATYVARDVTLKAMDKIASKSSMKTYEVGTVDYNASDKIKKSTPAEKLSKPESVDDIAKKANSLAGTPEGMNNCTLCTVASALRQGGYDTTAGSTWGSRQVLSDMVNRYYVGAKVDSCPHNLINHKTNTKDVSDWMVEKYGGEAYGIIDIYSAKYDICHAFNWSIKNGKVQFYDSQAQLTDASGLLSMNLNHVNTIRLDNCQVIDSNVTSQLNLYEPVK